MVPGGGIEPTTLSLEGFCSSTELPGQDTKRIAKNIEKSKKLYAFVGWILDAKKSIDKRLDFS